MVLTLEVKPDACSKVKGDEMKNGYITCVKGKNGKGVGEEKNAKKN